MNVDVYLSIKIFPINRARATPDHIAEKLPCMIGFSSLYCYGGGFGFGFRFRVIGTC